MVTGRRHTDPSYGDYSTVLLEAPLHGHTTILRRNSSKRRRQREASSCGCALPDRPKISQRIILDKMPTEILIKILRYTIEWAPPASLPRCPHQHTLFRRATAGDVSSSRNRGLSSSSSSSTSAPHPVFSPHQASAQPSVPSENPDEVRKFGINTLLDLLKTCKIFNEILLNEDPWTDETFWKVAARRCWKVLPETLEEIQGQEHTSCNWRIIAGIFMRSENGQFGTPGGGKGGVDCFGGNKACIQASSWETERAGREAIETEAPRNLKMVCAQPGPDAFTVTPDENTRSWTVSLCLRNGEEYIAHLDKCGRFGRAGRLPEGLKRSGNVGCFEPGIFEDIKDRSRLVKVEAIKSLESTEVPNRSQISSFQELQHWDISCVRKCVADEKAHVARCASHKGLLLCNLFTHRDPTAELDSLVDPPEDSRLFCIQSTGKEPEKSVFRWQREFVYADPTAYANARHLHYVICNIRMNQRAAVALVRWNESTPKSTRLLFDREFYVMAPSTGEIIRVLRFPNLCKFSDPRGKRYIT